MDACDDKNNSYSLEGHKIKGELSYLLSPTPVSFPGACDFSSSGSGRHIFKQYVAPLVGVWYQVTPHNKRCGI